jgi:methylenetetrahydrofolate reductase (NADPH)
MDTAAFRNRVRQALESGRFLMSVEFASPSADRAFDDAVSPAVDLARAIRNDPRIAAMALTDRSRSDDDCDPIAIAHRVADACGSMPIVHLAGKDRTLRTLETNLLRASAGGLDTFLLVTGDALRRPPVDRPVRYLDSVYALRAAREHSRAFLLAAALCPFKYREEELLNQYLKAGKKVRAGADVLITQIGWDMRKFEEARWVLTRRGYHVPLVAGLLFLRAHNCRRIRQGGLPGVMITDDLARKVEEEARAPDGGRAAAYRRLALQVVGVRHMGYAGVQVSGLHTYEHLARLLEEVEAASRDCPTPEAWRCAWQESLILADGRPARVAPPEWLCLAPGASANGVRPQPGEYVRHRAMDLLDHAAFQEGSAGARVLGPLVRALDARLDAGSALFRLESALKAPLVGCQGCGFCRLPDTAYVCPETCPKGLANGPCGGTRANLCEFGGQECVHNRIYRLSKQRGRLADLEEVLIPPVPDTTWNTCSWVTHFRGDGPRSVRLGIGGMGDADHR